MATTGKRSVIVTFSGDIQAGNVYAAADNAVSPGDHDVVDLASGNNTITVPPSTACVVTACTIVPPTGNTVDIVLKGVNGDTGIQLHDTDPTSIAIDSSVTSFVLNAASPVVGVQLIWS